MVDNDNDNDVEINKISKLITTQFYLLREFFFWGWGGVEVLKVGRSIQMVAIPKQMSFCTGGSAQTKFHQSIYSRLQVKVTFIRPDLSSCKETIMTIHSDHSISKWCPWQ